MDTQWVQWNFHFILRHTGFQVQLTVKVFTVLFREMATADVNETNSTLQTDRTMFNVHFEICNTMHLNRNSIIESIMVRIIGISSSQTSLWCNSEASIQQSELISFHIFNSIANCIACHVLIQLFHRINQSHVYCTEMKKYVDCTEAFRKK